MIAILSVSYKNEFFAVLESHTLLSLSLNIAQILLKNSPIEQLLADCCQALTDSGSFNSAWIALLSDDQTSFKSVQYGQHYESTSLKKTLAPFVLKNSLSQLGFVNTCVQEKQVITLKDVFDSSSEEINPQFKLWEAHYNMAEIHSAISVPLVFIPSSEPVGCLILTTSHENVCHEYTLLFLHLLSLNVSQAVEYKVKKINTKRTEFLLHQESIFLDNLLNSIPDLVFYKDLQGIYTGANTSFSEFCGQSDEELIGKTDYDLFDHKTAEFFREQDQIMLNSKTKRTNEEWIEYPDGKKILVETLKTPALDQNNEIFGLLGISRDITLRKRAEILLKENEARFRELLDSLPNIAIQGYDRNRNVIYWNQSSELLYGYSTEEALNKKIEQLIIPEKMRPELIESIEQWYENGVEIPSSEIILNNKDGKEVPVYSSHVMLKQTEGDSEIFFIDIDLTEQKNTHKKLEQLANFDQLTQLPNRGLFLEKFEQSLSEAKRFNKIVAVIFMDLDNFKYINDTFGHEIGDVLLIQVARRLTHGLREYDLISRFGGDEFVIALPYLESEQLIAPLVEKLKAEFNEPFELSGQSSYITCSMGVSIYPESGDNASALLKYADLAMYKAKEKGRNQFHFFSEHINHKVNRQIELSGQLISAMDNNEFTLLYQPQIDLTTGQIVACEALLRWHNKKLGDISPNEFIPIAEQSNLINKIDFWVLETIRNDLKEWIRSEKQPVRTFVNFSERGFSDNLFLSKLTKFIHENSFIIRYLGIELSEPVLLKTSEQTNLLLDFLHDSGISLVLDNFGHGCSSVSLLKNSSIDRIKISKEFIDKAVIDGHEESFINAIIAMSQALSIRTVAVGIENNNQKLYIEQTQCEIAQGFIYHKPMTADKLKKILKDSLG